MGLGAFLLFSFFFAFLVINCSIINESENFSAHRFEEMQDERFFLLWFRSHTERDVDGEKRRKKETADGMFAMICLIICSRKKLTRLALPLNNLAGEMKWNVLIDLRKLYASRWWPNAIEHKKKCKIYAQSRVSRFNCAMISVYLSCDPICIGPSS